jgi:hypothetical protein
MSRDTGCKGCGDSSQPFWCPRPVFLPLSTLSRDCGCNTSGESSGVFFFLPGAVPPCSCFLLCAGPFARFSIASPISTASLAVTLVMIHHKCFSFSQEQYRDCGCKGSGESSEPLTLRANCPKGFSCRGRPWPRLACPPRFASEPAVVVPVPQSPPQSRPPRLL